MIYLHRTKRPISFKYPRISPCTQTDHTSNNPRSIKRSHTFSAATSRICHPNSEPPFSCDARSPKTPSAERTWIVADRRESHSDDPDEKHTDAGQHAWTRGIDSVATQDLVLSNPARLVSRPTTTIDKSQLSFSLSLFLSFSRSLSIFLCPSSRICSPLRVSSLSRENSQCVKVSRTIIPWKIVARQLGNRGILEAGSNRVARGQRRVSLRVHAWTEHTGWFSNHRSMIRSSGFTLGAYSSLTETLPLYFPRTFTCSFASPRLSSIRAMTRRRDVRRLYSWSA